MVKAIDISKNELLKEELKTKYSNLTDAEMNQINESFDQFVETISLKTHQQKEEVERAVEEAVTYVQSKSL
jgi:hypothetical protein